MNRRRWLYLVVVEDSFHQYYLTRLTDRVNNLLTDLDKLRKKNPKIDNDILITRTLEKFDNYALAIIILLKKLKEL